MTTTLSITQARDEFPSLVENASQLLNEYVITVNGTPAAVLMSSAEFESWKETIEILSDSSLLKSIRQGEKDLAEGNFVTFDDLKKQLRLHV